VLRNLTHLLHARQSAKPNSASADFATGFSLDRQCLFSLSPLEPQASAFHSRTRTRPTRPSGTWRAYQNLSTLHVLTRALRTCTHFCSQHWLLCHLAVYSSNVSSKLLQVPIHEHTYFFKAHTDHATKFSCAGTMTRLCASCNALYSRILCAPYEEPAGYFFIGPV
jgi:hypothetical protein